MAYLVAIGLICVENVYVAIRVQKVHVAICFQFTLKKFLLQFVSNYVKKFSL